MRNIGFQNRDTAEKYRQDYINQGLWVSRIYVAEWSTGTEYWFEYGD